MSKLKTRKEFLEFSIRTASGFFALNPILQSLLPSDAHAEDVASKDALPSKLLKTDETEDRLSLKEALFYKKLEDKKIECQICPKKCKIADMERGFCGVRENRAGTYYTLVYARPCSIHCDPIEKKPLFHYLPGTDAYSLATAGCNMDCKFCQNWEIAQFRPEQVNFMTLDPQEIVQASKESKSKTIAFTYTEPVIFYEYMYDISVQARKSKIGSVAISNGYINPDPLKKLLGTLTGIKIDLKGFNESFYKQYCTGELSPVLETLKIIKTSGIWFEIVVLLIPSLNDDSDELRKMCSWIIQELGPDAPVHFTRFHPTYKVKNIPPTPVQTLETARKIATDTGIHFAYVGNVPGHKWEHTYCPGCSKTIIKRVGFTIVEKNIMDGKCGYCKSAIPGIWSEDQIFKQKNLL